MARIAWVEEKLQRWAAAVTVGDGSGYPVTSVLHPTWQPPALGITPTLKSASWGDVRGTHGAVQWLVHCRPRLGATVVAVYIMRQSAEAAGTLLECQPSTVHARIDEAHRLLAGRMQRAPRDERSF